MTSPPFFLPWIGKDYLLGIDGCRLLVLGESHYSEDPRNSYQEFTRDIVRRVDNGEHFQFFTKVSNVIQSGMEDGQFTWHSVGFYNFVQELVGEHARDRPTDRMWAAGIEPFERVLSKLQPDAVLTVGVGTWNSLSRYFPSNATSIATLSGEVVRRWQFSDIPPIVATWMDHPASFGFRSAEWGNRVSTLLAEAKLIDRDRRI